MREKLGGGIGERGDVRVRAMQLSVFLLTRELIVARTMLRKYTSLCLSRSLSPDIPTEVDTVKGAIYNLTFLFFLIWFLLRFVHFAIYVNGCLVFIVKIESL